MIDRQTVINCGAPPLTPIVTVAHFPTDSHELWRTSSHSFSYCHTLPYRQSLTMAHLLLVLYLLSHTSLQTDMCSGVDFIK